MNRRNFLTSPAVLTIALVPALATGARLDKVIYLPPEPWKGDPMEQRGYVGAVVSYDGKQYSRLYSFESKDELDRSVRLLAEFVHHPFFGTRSA